MERARDELPITHDIIRRKKDAKAFFKFEVQSFFGQGHIGALK